MSAGGYASNLPKLYAIRLLFWMHFFSAVLVPFYTDWGGITLQQVFLLNAWFFLCNFLFEVPTGTVADFLGRKWSLALGSGVGAAGLVLYASAPRIEVFVVAEAIMAVAYTLHSGADEALAYDSLKADDRQAAAAAVIGRMEAFKLGGIVAATILGGFIAARFGLRAPMLATVLPATLALAVAVTLREPPGRVPPGRGRSYLRILREGGRQFARHPVIRRLALEAAVTNAVAWGIIWLFQPLLRRAGVPLSAFGLVHALGCVAQIAFLSGIPALERWAGSRRRLIFLATLGSGAAFLGLAATTAWPLVVAGIAAGMALSLPRVPLFNAAINHHVSSSERATVLSFCSMVRTLAIVAMNPLTGLVAQRSLDAALLVMGGALVAFAFASRLQEGQLAPSPGAVP
ncbi:MAG TPA: MFS transporter [Vicinamibacteria bacterium]|nr:MFS transporter [Vicinamibacteria bacterium]